ncbi:MAG TPA: hypothetical protein PKY81_11555 [bacterium]|nr:hypothetical protein [bacterium]HPN31584.1 hypothetical protein [bacterium]
MKKNKSSEEALETIKTLNHKFKQVLDNYFPELKRFLKKTDDRRHQSYIDYPREYIHLFIILSAMFRVKASRLSSIELLGKNTIENINKLAGTNLDKIIHDSTISYFYNFEDYSADELLKIPAQLVRSIIRKRTLEKFRLLDKYYLVAVDGTGIASFNKRHCDKCLTKKNNDGSITYFHNVLTAQIVTYTGYAFIIDFEFIENSGHSEYEKQDAEYKAFKRMYPRIIKNFPQELFCFLLDGLYADSVIMSMVGERSYFFIALQDKDFKSANEDFEGLYKLAAENNIKFGEQSIRFVNNMNYKNCEFSIIESIEPHTSPNAKTDSLKLKYLTNIPVSKSNVEKLINQGGRLRGIIENQGYNVLKNDYSLEHPFRKKSLAAIKSVICLTCIAYIIFQFFIVASCKCKQRVFEIFKALKILADKLKQTFSSEPLPVLKIPLRVSFASY